MKYLLHNKPLKKKGKRKQQKYLLLLSNDVVIIGSEFEVMRKYRKEFSGKPILEMLPTSARLNNQTTVLTKLLESLEREKI